MRYITERELRDCFKGGVPARYEVPGDAKLTPSARQYLMDLRIYPLGGTARPAPLPAGGKKPEHMTHLNNREMAPKDHPRILLRGKLDTLESEILLVMMAAPESFRQPLQDALDLTRQVLAADVKDAPIPPWRLDGMDPEQVHWRSHHPEELGFAGHILPGPEHGILAARLNRLRALCRETEAAAVFAYRQGERLSHEDCVLALNRLSSYFYVLQLRAAQEREGLQWIK